MGNYRCIRFDFYGDHFYGSFLENSCQRETVKNMLRAEHCLDAYFTWSQSTKWYGAQELAKKISAQFPDLIIRLRESCEYWQRDDFFQGSMNPIAGEDIFNVDETYFTVEILKRKLEQVRQLKIEESLEKQRIARENLLKEEEKKRIFEEKKIKILNRLTEEELQILHQHFTKM